MWIRAQTATTDLATIVIQLDLAQMPFQKGTRIDTRRGMRLKINQIAALRMPAGFEESDGSPLRIVRPPKHSWRYAHPVRQTRDWRASPWPARSSAPPPSGALPTRRHRDSAADAPAQNAVAVGRYPCASGCTPRPSAWSAKRSNKCALRLDHGDDPPAPPASSRSSAGSTSRLPAGADNNKAAASGMVDMRDSGACGGEEKLLRISPARPKLARDPRVVPTSSALDQ